MLKKYGVFLFGFVAGAVTAAAVALAVILPVVPNYADDAVEQLFLATSTVLGGEGEPRPAKDVFATLVQKVDYLTLTVGYAYPAIRSDRAKKQLRTTLAKFTNSDLSTDPAFAAILNPAARQIRACILDQPEPEIANCLNGALPRYTQSKPPAIPG